MDLLFYSFTVFLFAAVILLIEGVYLWWSSTHGKAAQRIARRLQVMSGGIGRSGERISILKQRRFSAHDGVDHLLHRISPLQQLDALLVQAGSKLTVERFLGCSLAAFVFALMASALLPLPSALRIVLALPVLGLPYFLIRRARTRRLHRIEHQLPDAADFIARALRAGHSFTNVLQIVGNELPEPLSSEFRVAREEINYGVPMGEALHNMAERIPLTDLRYLIIAVLIQRESGGNLAEILGNIGTIIRSRLKLVAQVRVLSAEGRMSAWILSLLPFVVMLALTVLNPEYVSLLWTDPTGIRLLWYAAGMILVGVVWLRRVIRIRI
ncbi:type II secretion system F family protein [Massilia jejuensis]|uniref:Type II secretion system F family protein n=1 Tax=Massilia jejuensis TaxID=648894 RepID=A0ABW0PHH0_9BURK